jgi:serine/threonine protein phosphatase PrpC
MGNFLDKPITEKETFCGNVEGKKIKFAVSAMQGWRRDMEDAHITQNHFPGAPSMSLFSVFDGHGGSLIANQSKQRLVDKLKSMEHFKTSSAHPQKLGECLRKAYLDMDQDMLSLPEVERGEDKSGCTALSVLITEKHIICANSGDSRSVMATNGKTIELSFDHKPTNPVEKSRIENAGGTVTNKRVNGDLAVSRALGDFEYKKTTTCRPEEQQVSAEPEIKVQDRAPGDEFVILACDGIWDVMSSDDANNFVRTLMNEGETDLSLICEEILDECLMRNSRDNMSVILIVFEDGVKYGSGGGVSARREKREKEKEQQEAQQK